MHPDLEAIVSVDEEARARVALAAERRARELAAATAARDAAIEAHRRRLHEALDLALQTIREEGDVRIADIQRRREQYLAALAAAGETKFEDAVACYLRMVCEVAS